MHANALGMASLGSDFAVGYIRVMEGEKDPRNLLVAFDVLRQILLHIPLSPAHVEVCAFRPSISTGFARSRMFIDVHIGIVS